jgi:hypothetical protein
MRRTATLGLALLLALTALLEVFSRRSTRSRWWASGGTSLRPDADSRTLYVVGFDAALDPANDRTSKAILSRRSLMAPKPDVCRLGELIYPLA